MNTQAAKWANNNRSQGRELDLKEYSGPDWMSTAYKNNHYVVMIEEGGRMNNGVTAIKAMVQRHDDKPIPHH
ncbi:hypothetical protein [Endozoicomonas sp.]|uniref:hypothetical protein n=1 Tax=Endozoicomonas sp. TaxID=1892382 RepID=UPI003AF421BB